MNIDRLKTAFVEDTSSDSLNKSKAQTPKTTTPTDSPDAAFLTPSLKALFPDSALK